MTAALEVAKLALPKADKDPSVREIIASARSRQKPAVDRPSSLGAWLLSSVSMVLLWASFTPVDCGPLAWIALVPLCLLVRIPQPTRWMYRAVYLTALVGQVATLQWMRLGDPTMYIAMAALAAYCALYFPVFVALSRFAHHRGSVPLVLTVPVIWTGLEYFRAYLITGFSWYYLGHSQYRWLEVIQISDVVGAYGVSFVVALANASLAGLVPTGWLQRLRLLTPDAALLQSAIPFRAAFPPVIAAVILVASVVGYGVARRGQAEFQAGPRVALIQGNFEAFVPRAGKPPHDQEKMMLSHLRLTGLAVREQPDLIVWPESMYPYILLDAAPEMTNEKLGELMPGSNADPKIWREGIVQQELVRESQRAGAALLWGLHAARAEPQGVQQYNSAAFVTPEQGLVGRYDKRHLVPFGEYLPLRSVLPFLQHFTPYGGNAGLAAGTQPAAFEYKSWTFAPVICFEDTVPHLVRKAATVGKNQKADVLVNMTNDGWFGGSSELDQHLITAAFRAVECRTPLVRAVNTGISAIIDGDGAIVEPDVFIDGDWRKGSETPPRTSTRDPQTGERYRQLSAALIHTVPLDHRGSLYLRFGDWFAATCAAGVIAVLATMVLSRRRPLPEQAARAL